MLQLTFCGTSAAALNQICAFCLANYHKLENEAETNRLCSRLMRTSEQSNLLYGGKRNTAYIHLKHYEGSNMNNRKWRVVKSHLSQSPSTTETPSGSNITICGKYWAGKQNASESAADYYAG